MKMRVRRVAAVIMFAVIVWGGLSAPPAYAEEGEGGGNKASVQGPNYVHFAPISFSVIGPDDRIAEEVSITLVIQMAPGKAETVLDAYTPRLQDAYLTALSDLWDQHPVGTPVVSAKEIKDKLFKVTTDITGPGFVSAILIDGIDERMR